jgi:hypothetical protein
VGTARFGSTVAKSFGTVAESVTSFVPSVASVAELATSVAGSATTLAESVTSAAGLVTSVAGSAPSLAESNPVEAVGVPRGWRAVGFKACCFGGLQKRCQEDPPGIMWVTGPIQVQIEVPMDYHSGIPLGSSGDLAGKSLQPRCCLWDVENPPVVVRPGPVHPAEGEAAHGRDRAKPQPDRLRFVVHEVVADVGICSGYQVILD